MKKLIIIIVSIALTSNCSNAKKNKVAGDTKTSQVQNDTYLKATIDGASFYADDPGNLSTLNTISILATDKNEKQKIKIFMDYNKGPGTYTIGKGKNSLIYTNNKDHWIASRVRGEGTIILTEEGDYLVGEFNFIGTGNDNTDKKHITDGEFRVSKK